MIAFFTLTRQNKILVKELTGAIKEVVDRGIFILGPKVEEFEREFAKYIGVKYAVGVASGTDAISLALLAIGVAEGDEVIMPANAYPSVFAVTQIGAIPKLVDINPATYNIDSSKIEKTITDKTKAILPVHLYGQPAQMEKILEIGKKYKIPVVEDCAQAVGAEVNIKYQISNIKYTNKKLKIEGHQTEKRSRHLGKGTPQGCAAGATPPLGWRNCRGGGIWKKVGSIGDVGCFSFYPTKNLGAFGDGGMVVTNNEEIYKKVKLLRMYGEEGRYHSVILGRNSRLDELQAAILLVKLKYLEKWNEKRREIAGLYHLLLTPPPGRSPSATFQVSLTPIASSLASPASKNNVYHLFVIRTKKRDQLKAYLEKKGIQTAIHYPIPIHLVPSMKLLGYKKGDFPESEEACEEVLSLPMYPELTDEEVETVVKNIKEFEQH